MLGAACRLKSKDEDEEAQACDRMCTIVFGLTLSDRVVPVSKKGGLSCFSGLYTIWPKVYGHPSLNAALRTFTYIIWTKAILTLQYIAVFYGRSWLRL